MSRSSKRRRVYRSGSSTSAPAQPSVSHVLHTLPYELLVHIFLFLPYQDCLLNLTSTCRRLKLAVEWEQHWRSRLHSELKPDPSSRHFVPVPPGCKKSYRLMYIIERFNREELLNLVDYTVHPLASQLCLDPSLDFTDIPRMKQLVDEAVASRAGFSQAQLLARAQTQAQAKQDQALRDQRRHELILQHLEEQQNQKNSA